MWFIVVLLIFAGVCWVIAKSSESVNNNIVAQRTEQINDLQSKYFNNLQNACIEKGIAVPSKSILNKEEIRVAYNGSKNYAPGYYWDDGKNIVFFNDSLNQYGKEFTENLLLIPFEDIVFYTKDGNVSYTNEIVNAGKNISISGAIVGGLIAGDAGAIIGANKDANKLENHTVEHDDVHTFIYYNAGNDTVKLADFKGKDFYSYILHLLPQKEYNYVNNHPSKKNALEPNSTKEALKKLKDLFENDLIDETEYKNKKEELLKQL